ncbi:arrestin domain-containing protein 17-like [Haematobia irritans]|uniref:arrestin domain-containing protein 17-like n=1 Tax=Haematobia irritans TaxID=7368 RepID=UPI003F4F6439
MPSTCKFQLNSPNGVYYSGQTVSGNVILNTESVKDIRNIRIRFLGESKVSWSETERRRRSDGHYHSHTVYYRANEVYVDNATLVRGAGKLPKGTYTFSFNIFLPLACPTSCEGRYGHTRYALWLIIDRPLRFDNEFSKPLTVLRTADLNLNPAFKVPVQAEEIASLGCWPCSSGKITYILRVPFGAYAAGQTLRYSLLIQNQSMSDISGFEVEFNELVTFTAHTPRHKTRETNTTLAHQVREEQCLRLSNRQIDGELVLPSLPPDTEGMGIIRVQHTLDFELEVDGCHTNKTISVPIFIGTIPIRESLMSVPSMNLPESSDNGYTNIMPTAPLLPQADDNMDKPPSYGDLQPPSFEEAMRSESPFKDPDANEHSQVIGFRPLYPVYPQAKQ